MSDIRVILCPVNFSLESRAALAHAREIASSTGASIVLLHAIDLVGDDEGLVAMLAQEEDDEACPETRISMLADELGGDGCDVRYFLEYGDPAQVICKQAELLGADMIIMTTAARKGMKRLLMGSTAENVIRDAECPVVVVKGKK